MQICSRFISIFIFHMPKIKDDREEEKNDRNEINKNRIFKRSGKEEWKKKHHNRFVSVKHFHSKIKYDLNVLYWLIVLIGYSIDGFLFVGQTKKFHPQKQSNSKFPSEWLN